MAKSWTTLIVGVWIVISPWLLGFADISVMKWSNLAAGTVVILFAVWDIFGEKPQTPSVEEHKK
ncbi:MAG TPA: SPW repeat protein [Candidatus Paceibacterota bacterium]|nr:SPW repeat protein [Candidatus Paceibacterota bacterium]